MIITTGMETNMRLSNSQNGITLLITLLVMGLILAISSSLLNITLKQYQIAGIAKASETAFHAANAGIECVRYWDQNISGGVVRDTYKIGNTNIDPDCMGAANLLGEFAGPVQSGDRQNYRYNWSLSNDHEELCTDISVYKFGDPASDVPMDSAEVNRDCRAGNVCTVIQSRGYSASCDDRTDSRTVERELIINY